MQRETDSEEEEDDSYDRQVSSTSVELDAHFEPIAWLAGDKRTGPCAR